MKKALPLPARSPPLESVPPWEIGGWREKVAPSQEGASGRGNSMGNGSGGGGGRKQQECWEGRAVGGAGAQREGGRGGR